MVILLKNKPFIHILTPFSCLYIIEYRLCVFVCVRVQVYLCQVQIIRNITLKKKYATFDWKTRLKTRLISIICELIRLQINSIDTSYMPII